MTRTLPQLSTRALRWSGVLLVISGFVHGIWFAFTQGDWEGDTSLRKPILFGISAGVTLLSLGWLVPKLRSRRFDNLLFVTFAVAMTVEVALITLQQWRGVPSHFNRSTTFDAMILNVIEGLILFATLVIADVTWRSLRHLDATSDMKLAIRGGMLLLLLGCLLGIFATVHGAQQQSLGKPPGIYGDAGIVKFAHGMPLHAIQFLPAIAWALARLRIDEQQRRKFVFLCLGALVSLTLFSCVQTFSGRARFDVAPLSIPFLAVAVVLVVIGTMNLLRRHLGKLKLDVS